MRETQERIGVHVKQQCARIEVEMGRLAICAARFKSQMICSNQNKSHLVIFCACFIVLVVFLSLQQ